MVSTFAKFGFTCSFVALSLAACSDTSEGSCLSEVLPLQGADRIVAGSTYYLPQPTEACSGAQWRLAAAPPSHQNELIRGADGYDRIVVLDSGEYRFELEGSSDSRTITVVPQEPFAHYHYYPSSSVALVGDELWVANTFDPAITRIDGRTRETLGTIQTGPWPTAVAWRPGMAAAVVTQRAGDTLGFIDLQTQRLVDAVWVGDEPADVVVSPDGKIAFVSLPTEGKVAVVDLETRELLTQIETNPDPLAMAVSDDGTRVYVASHRSGQSDRGPYEDDPRMDQFDIAVIDTTRNEVESYLESVGSNINGLLVHEDKLYVATTKMVPAELSPEPGMTAFRHSIVVYDRASGDELLVADLGRQPSAPDFAVRPYEMVIDNDTLWVAIEGSDLVLGLDPQTLEEKLRTDVPGRPRSLVATEDGLFVHGALNYSVTVLDETGSNLDYIEYSGDPRTATEALGQELFTGVGELSGANHGCTDCHADGLSDGNVWQASIAEYFAASRPLFWLEGTEPIGWEADGADLRSYLYSSPGPTISLAIDDTSVNAFYDFMASLVPPPRANGWTKRDGSPTDAAVRGEEVFSAAGCVACHSGSVTTNRVRYPFGTQDEPTEVPSLIGSYRHVHWLLAGAAKNLDEAVEAMYPLSGNPQVDDQQHQDLVRYLQELTAREFFVLSSKPAQGERAAPTDKPIEVLFSYPVWDDVSNLAAVSLVDANGNVVEASVEVDHRKLRLTPSTALAAGETYTVAIDSQFEAFNELPVVEATDIEFTVAGSPSIELSGDYDFVVYKPNLNLQTAEYSRDSTKELVMAFSATSTVYGATIDGELREGFPAQYDVVIDGDTSYWPPLLFSEAPRSINKSFPTTAQLFDDDGDGRADRAEGTLLFRGPGLEAEDVRWELRPPSDEPEPECGTQTGDVELDLDINGGTPIVSWEGDLEAIGLYFIEPQAQPPAGPGAVEGGEAYWVLGTDRFPEGFGSPVTYGEAPEGGSDVTDQSGGPIGGAELPSGECVKLIVVFTDFSRGELTLVWE